MTYKTLIIDNQTIYYDFPFRYPNILFINIDNLVENKTAFNENEIIELEDRIARLIITYHQKTEINQVSYLNLKPPGEWKLITQQK